MDSTLPFLPSCHWAPQQHCLFKSQISKQRKKKKGKKVSKVSKTVPVYTKCSKTTTRKHASILPNKPQSCLPTRERVSSDQVHRREMTFLSFCCFFFFLIIIFCFAAAVQLHQPSHPPAFSRYRYSRSVAVQCWVTFVESWRQLH